MHSQASEAFLRPVQSHMQSLKFFASKCPIYNKGNSKHTVFFASGQTKKTWAAKNGRKERKEKNSGVTVSPVLQGQLLQKEKWDLFSQTKKSRTDDHPRIPASERREQGKKWVSQEIRSMGTYSFPPSRTTICSTKNGSSISFSYPPLPSPSIPPLSCTLHSRVEITNRQ